jgi:hypothetical protein
VSFEYVNPAPIHEAPGARMGMVAQKVEPVFPDWVDTGASGYKRLTFRGLEALTVEALRELRSEKDLPPWQDSTGTNPASDGNRPLAAPEKSLTGIFTWNSPRPDRTSLKLARYEQTR